MAPVMRGTADGFRQKTFLERSVARLHVPEPVRGRMRSAYEQLLWVATAGRGLKARLPEGEVVKLLPACRGMSWNAEEYAALRHATRPGDIVLDAGANVGAYSVLFAQWVGPAGHVFAFEPVPSIAALLREQLRLNRLEKRVTVVEWAVLERTGSLLLRAPGMVGLNRPALPGDPDEERLRVSGTAIDEFCEQNGIRPSLIKIDVEGAELAALRGARRTLAAPHLREAFVEWHPSLWPVLGYSAADLKQELAEQGLSAVQLQPGADVWCVEGICARLVKAAACAS